MKRVIRYVSLGSRGVLTLPVHWLGCESRRVASVRFFPYSIYHVGSTKSVCYPDAIISRSHLHTRCTPKTTTLDGVKAQPLKKLFPLTSILNLWEFGKFELRRICHGLTPERVRDTVSSVGVVPRRLPFTKVNDNIRYFRHALSLDERRAYVFFLFKYRPMTNLVIQPIQSKLLQPIHRGRT